MFLSKAIQIKPGDRIELVSGKISMVLAIYNPSYGIAFYCEDLSGASTAFSEEQVKRWDSSLEYLYLKEYKPFIGKPFNWMSHYSFSKIVFCSANENVRNFTTTNEKAEKVTNDVAIICPECNGTGEFVTDFYTRTCNCRLK